DGPSMRGAVLAADMELEKRGRRRLDLVPTPLRFGRNRCNRRNIAPSLEPMTMGRSRMTSGSKGKATLSRLTDAHLHPLAAYPSAKRKRPRSRTRWLYDHV